jgi:hypothetical protein
MQFLGAVCVFLALCAFSASAFGSFSNGIQQLVVIGWGVGLLGLAVIVQLNIAAHYLEILTNQDAEVDGD